MVELARKSKISAKDYLEGEKQTDIKHEYINGDVYAMGGASDRHGLIAGSFFVGLYNGLPEKCDIFMSDMKVRVQNQDDDSFYYPDILISCDPDDNHSYYREMPILIVEVLSSSTERIDRGEKMSRYKQIPTLQEYILVTQDYPKVEIFRRDNAWRTEEYYIEHSFHLKSVDMEFKVADLYQRVNIQTAT